MNLQARKLNIIDYLIGIQDEKLFKKIEISILETKKNQETETLIPQFTQEELLQRAIQSNLDYSQGNVKSQTQLESESQNW